MNILKLLDKLSDDKFFTKEASRLETISNLTSFGKKVAVAAVPLGLGAMMTTSVRAETTSNTTASSAVLKDALTDALQLALVLEYLEDEYYRMGLSKANLIPSADRTVFTQISKH